ncbi:hypothetical protein D0Y65_029588 [Glycine soja]|uniref:Uncharacterized protein n=1 Tax=Glycine soja TaxID=3848 RepID=A0A445HZV1_GLYSO|nr:hypothetical protein D0Y65_029588 [Glycine soja]
MYLKKPLWSETGKDDGGSAKTEEEDHGDGAVSEVVKSLQQQRVYREVTLALRTGLRDARAEFSFLRVRALRSILKFLRSVAESGSTIDLFNQTQSIPQLQGLFCSLLHSVKYVFVHCSLLFAVVPVLFHHSLKESGDDDYNEKKIKVGDLSHILFGVEPMKLTSPSTDAEVALALRVLEGCCLLHPQSTALAHQHNAIQVLMNILSTRGVLEQGACLDALISLMVDSSSNQMDFEKCSGIMEVADLLRDKQLDENLRYCCFLQLVSFILMLYNLSDMDLWLSSVDK